MMNAEKIRARIEEIRALVYDDEMAHVKEDELYEDFIRSIAMGECTNPQDCAQMILTTKDINFARWCA